jgi:hypothetical protein
MKRVLAALISTSLFALFPTLTHAIPTLTFLAPSVGPVGTQVTATGSGFAPTNNIVNFGNGIASSVSSPDGTSLSFTVPTYWLPACTLSIPACPFAQVLIIPGIYEVSVTNANGTSDSMVFVVGQGVIDPPTVPVVEFYNSNLGHYFMSSLAAEIDALDSGRVSGWGRTGYSFNAFAGTVAGASPVCRYYIPPPLGDSHFFSASPVECNEVGAMFPSLELESASAFYIALPDAMTGACPAGTVPVYRLWSSHGDSFHRYTTNPAVRDQMKAQGFVVEGYGADAVSMCAPD